MVKIPRQFDRLKYPILQFNGVHSFVFVEHSNTNPLLYVKHFTFLQIQLHVSAVYDHHRTITTIL